MISVSPAPLTFAYPSLLLLEPDVDTRHEYVRLLGGQFAITAVGSSEGGFDHLARMPPAVLVTDLVLPDGDAFEVCRAAKSLENAPAVLITTMDVERVPEAIEAGCDSVLLKPFAPNLLLARLSRLVRGQAQVLRMQSADNGTRAHDMINGTNRFWPNIRCPHCGHVGITSFDYCAYRRVWYACLACRKVWIGARGE